MSKTTLTALQGLLSKLAKERETHVAAIQQIDAVFANFGMAPPGGGGTGSGGARRGRRKAAGRKGRGRGLRPGGKRVQGVKTTLHEALTDKPQSPGDLQKKVSQKLGTKVAIATQLNALKKEGLAKSVGRGQWVRGKK
ncbi:MAG: hypothetical protein AB7G17_08045 [Phycisphaerales bacterium]